MITCTKCQKVSETEMHPMFWFRVLRNGSITRFCSRRCLVEYLFPELGKAIVPAQWVPNEDENERMSQ